MGKITKLSLVALVSLSTVAFADDTKVSGKVKLWYQTMAHEGVTGDKGLFSYDDANDNDWANIGAQLAIDTKANDHVDVRASLYGVTTMGFESFLTGGETNTRTGELISNQNISGSNAFPLWLHELNFTYKVGNTNLKFGRQELNTPLAYTENWNAAPNSFEAAVLTNTDLPDTTIIGAWVAKGNGATDNIVEAPQVFGVEDSFYSYMGYDLDSDGYAITDTDDAKGGAAVLGVVNKSLSFLPIQAYYYNVTEVAHAWWLQGDTKLDLAGIKISAQGIAAGIGTQDKVKTYIESLSSNNNAKDTIGVAGKVNANISGINVNFALSKTSAGNIPLANTATNYKKTKLPTASIFSDGMVAAQPNTFAMKFGASMKIGEASTIAASFGMYTNGQNSGYAQVNARSGGPGSMGWIAQNRGEDITSTEIDVVYKTKLTDDISLAAMYINLSNTYVPGGDYTSSADMGDYGTFGDNIVRIVLTETF